MRHAKRTTSSVFRSINSINMAPNAPILGENTMKTLNQFMKNESGATAIEYGLIAALISVVIIVSVTAVGTNVSATFAKIATTLSK